MNIETTIGYLIDNGYWDKYCEMVGWNVRCVNEGRASSDEIVKITLEQAQKIGLEINLKPETYSLR